MIQAACQNLEKNTAGIYWTEWEIPEMTLFSYARISVMCCKSISVRRWRGQNCICPATNKHSRAGITKLFHILIQKQFQTHSLPVYDHIASLCQIQLSGCCLHGRILLRKYFMHFSCNLTTGNTGAVIIWSASSSHTTSKCSVGHQWGAEHISEIKNYCLCSQLHCCSIEDSNLSRRKKKNLPVQPLVTWKSVWGLEWELASHNSMLVYISFC